MELEKEKLTYNFDDYDFIGDIESIEKQLISKYGKCFDRLSNWDPDTNFNKIINSPLPDKRYDKSVEYFFSYEIDEKIKTKLIKSFGVNSNNYDLLVTQSGTQSIYNVVSYLSRKGINKLGLVTPCYFSVAHSCNALKVDYVKSYLFRDKSSGNFFIDEKNIDILNDCDAIWITNPIYSTSVYYEDCMKNLVEKYLKSGKYVIFDECLANSGTELIRLYNHYERAISICSPMKPISHNSEKFSVVLADKGIIKDLNIWSDVINGSLSTSCLKSINYYLSSDFNITKKILMAYCFDRKQRVMHLCDKYNVLYDKKSNGCFVSIYFDEVKYNKFDCPKLMSEIFERFKISFIPGSRNDMNKSLGFNFRINLYRFDSSSYEKLELLMKYLKNGLNNELYK